MAKAGIVREFFEFIWEDKKWWLVPIIVILLLMVIFIALMESPGILPFIYPLI